MKSPADNDGPGPLWRRVRFKGNKAWLAVHANGRPIEKNRKVLIKYRLEQDYEYWVLPENITEIEDGQTSPPPKKTRSSPTPVSVSEEPQEGDLRAIRVYTDGASSGNPGPSGVGVVFEFENRTREISKFIGIATNNIAELEAIRTGLLELKRKDLPVRIYTDSEYAFGVLVRGWKARKNTALVETLRGMIKDFPDLRMIKVKGHAGHKQNERADRLARDAAGSGGGNSSVFPD